MERVTVCAMLLCFLVYLLMGITGFLAFGEGTAGNVLPNRVDGMFLEILAICWERKTGIDSVRASANHRVPQGRQVRISLALLFRK